MSPFLSRLVHEKLLPLLIASLLTPFTLTSCGANRGASSASAPLPPAIPSAEPVLLFVGTGTSPTDVTAIESVLTSLALGYTTANSAELDALSEPQLAGYKLLIVPGGNSIEIGQGLSVSTAANIRGAVTDYGLNYLGICAGAFFGAYSIYNSVDLTNGASFNFYQDEFKGIHIEAVEISFPDGNQMDVYWQDGPELSGWGQVVAKFPDGTAAIAQGSCGKGFVMFTGVHLEAPLSWRGSLNFTTPVAVDVAYAGTVIQAAFNRTPLAQF